MAQIPDHFGGRLPADAHGHLTEPEAREFWGADPFSTELRPTERQYERDQRIVDIARRALHDIVRCDYRGNEPHEQMIARLALAEMERVR